MHGLNVKHILSLAKGMRCFWIATCIWQNSFEGIRHSRVKWGLLLGLYVTLSWESYVDDSHPRGCYVNHACANLYNIRLISQGFTKALRGFSKDLENAHERRLRMCRFITRIVNWYTGMHTCMVVAIMHTWRCCAHFSVGRTYTVDIISLPVLTFCVYMEIYLLQTSSRESKSKVIL